MVKYNHSVAFQLFLPGASEDTMIEKLYKSYDDCNYYIDTNKKKLAHDNAAVIAGLLTFFAVVSVIFIAVALAFGDGLKHYLVFFPAILVLLVLVLINSYITKKLVFEFWKIRIYAFFFYTILIMAFSIADTNTFRTSRIVFFPVAIMMLSMLYMDYFWVSTFYRVFLGAAFLLYDYQIKEKSVFTSDLMIVCLVIVASMFCYSAVINISLSRHEDSLQLEKKSQTDLLTGLLNKISFEEKCKEYLENRVIGAKCTMFIFDLDDFKDVNDNFGHQTGDKLLKLFSEI